MEERYIDVFRGIDYLEEKMGAAWLKKIIKQIKAHGNGGASFGRGIDFSSCGVSPVAYYWYRAREELALAGIKGGNDVGLSSMHAAVIAGDLMILAGSDGLEKRIEGLKDPARGVLVQKELCIAAGYARNGHRVEFSGRDGFFTASARRKINAVVTGIEDSGERIEYDGGYPKDQHSNIPGPSRAATILKKETVKYVYVSETPGASAGRPDNKSREFPPGLEEPGGFSGVIFRIMPAYINRKPVIIRSGKLVNPGGVQDLEDIYVPGEKLLPAQF